MALFLLGKVLRKWYRRTRTIACFHAENVTPNILEVGDEMAHGSALSCRDGI